MRHGTANRRQRNRNNSGRRGNSNRAQVYDSNGPDVRIRGTAHQVCEKYLALAKDANAGGDRILAESYMQHAEHYQRLINQFETTANDKNEVNERSNNDKNTPKAQDEAAGNQKEQPGNAAMQEDDLSLPSSILGDVPNKKTEEASVTRTPVRMEAEETAG